jgi:hypothetical protein
MKQTFFLKKPSLNASKVKLQAVPYEKELNVAISEIQ